MLRLLVAALLLANLLFFTWSRGWLDSIVGIPAQGEREPQRLASQVRPEQVTLMGPSQAASTAAAAASSTDGTAPTPASAARAAAPAGSTAVDGALAAVSPPSTAASAAPRPVAMPATAASAARPASGPAASTALAAASTALPSKASSVPPAITPPTAASAITASAAAACLEVGPLVPADLAAIDAALRTALPAGSWSEQKTDGAGEWMIYMGPYPDREWAERKKRELARIRGGVTQEDVTTPPELAGGISLGRFPSQAAASTTLAQYKTRGIRTARVVRAGPGAAASYLRVADADPALARRVAALKLPVAGRSFTACVR